MACLTNNKYTLALCILILAFLVSPSPVVFADQDDQGPSEDMSMTLDEEMLFEDIPSVFSASKYEQKVTQAPSSVSIITADEIRKHGYRDFGEIMQSIRGFYVTKDRNYFYVGVRGFGLPADYSNRMLILLDGTRTNDNVYDAGALESMVDVDLIDRIEVVRGPSSSLYGSNAFFATINVITKRGRDYDGLEISGAVGSHDTYKPMATFGKKTVSGFEMLISGSYMDSDGDDRLHYAEFDDPETNNGIAKDRDSVENKNFMAKFSYKDFSLIASYNKYEKDVPTAPWETIFNGNLWTEDESFIAGLTYEHSYQNGFDLIGRLNYNYYKYKGEYPYEGDTDWDEPPVVVNDDRVKGEYILADVQVTKLFKEKHKVTLGASVQDNFKQEQQTEYRGVDPEEWGFLDDDHQTTVWAVYLQDEFTITDKVILNAGVRYDDYETFGDTTNPRAALIYNPEENISVKLVYGTAFRAPSAYELYFDDGVYQKSNHDLDPETIDSYEVIYEQFFTNHIRGTAVGYYYKIEDIIINSLDPDDEMEVFVNASDDVDAYGFELEVDGKWENGWQGRLSYTYQDTEDQDTDRELSNSPDHLVKLNVTAPLWRDKIFLSLEELYTSKRRTLFREKNEADSDNYSDAYFLTNVTLYGQRLWKNLDISASVYNLFDKDYDDPGSFEHLQDEIERNGRTYRLKMSYTF